MSWSRKLVLGAAALAILASPARPSEGAKNPSLFPVSGVIQEQKQFWMRVFARVSTSEVVIHDEETLQVFSVMRLDAPWDGRSSQRHAIRAERERHEAVLLALADGRTPPPGTAALAERLRKALAGESRQEMRRAAYSLRAQPGLKEKFREGYIRSGRYLPRFEAIFRSRNLPADLALLPHVESGFEERAYSKARAVGMWQFMQPTARLFMRADGAVDGRRDPFIAAEGAADLLRQNYQELGAWPLALTAYNHGAQGMQRAVATVGSRDMDLIVRRYKGRLFGFASRNFYGEFLAAVHIHRNIREFYGPLRQDPPARFDVFHVPRPVSLTDLAQRIGVPREALRPMNPALGAWVARGKGHIPRGYPLRVPAGQGTQVARAYAAGASQPAAAPEGSEWAFVAPGDTLSAIASRHKVTVAALMSANGLQDALIHPGDRLSVPAASSRKPEKKAPEKREAAPVQVAKKEAAPVQAARKEEPPAVEPGEALKEIARADGLTIQDFIEAAELEDIETQSEDDFLLAEAVPQKEGPPAPLQAREEPAPRVAVVKKGDTLVEIAARHKVSVQDLMAANKLRGTLIRPGDRLALPGMPAPEKLKKKEAPVQAALVPAAPPSVKSPASLDAKEAAPTAPLAALREEALRQALAVSVPNGSQIGRVSIYESETISHFAEWLEVSPVRLRQLNDIRGGRAMPMGRTLKVPLDRVSRAEFLERRLSYHRGLKEEFDRKFEVSGTVRHKLAPKENVWVLVTRTYKIPLWLVRGYNPGKDLRRLAAGEEIVFPLVKPR